MQIQIESTDQITEVNNVVCRVWKGVTASGVECILLIHRVVVADTADNSQFETELKEQLTPGRHVPLSMIL